MEYQITDALQKALLELYNIDTQLDKSSIQRTKKEFEGDYTFVVFPYVKQARLSPETLANQLGEKVCTLLPHLVSSFNVVKGFLNISIANDFWTRYIISRNSEENYNYTIDNQDITLIEFSSPNTNKPLHLGHVRNNLLGNSVANIMSAAGKRVIRVNLVNDRGIHICKSMLAWLRYGNGETPESSGIKGDHLVGKYYVEFDKHYKQEIDQLVAQGMSADEAAKKAPLLIEAQAMLKKWEDNDPEIRNLWAMMNDWVYAGFDTTYQRMGITFNKTYYESQTYLLGKSLVEEGLSNGAFYRREDGSVWVDLTDENLDEKLLLRSDGTSVYMTQDLGTAQLRYDEFHPKNMIYVVGNEQNYHFDVLKLVLGKKLKKEFGNSIYHLSYGMVELPFGKMKSREGTVVDADDLMEEMYLQAKESTEALGKFEFSEEEAKRLYEMIGLGALKYFILKVDPKKNMLFNPNESIDFNGNTAPFIQYTHARIKSMLRKAKENNINFTQLSINAEQLSDTEKQIIKQIYEYKNILKTAADTFSPALIANYTYDLAKDFNRFYQETPIFKEENEALRAFRLLISSCCARTIATAMNLLGIDVPEKM